MSTNPLLTLLSDTAREEGPLLAAALEQFALTGVRRTSTDDIARRAGVNRATLYRRLGTKDEIVSAAFLYEASRVLAQIDTELGDLGDDVDGRDGYIVRFFVITLTTLRQNRLLRQLLEVDRDEILRALTIGAGRVLELASQYLVVRIREIRAHTGGPTDAAEIAALSGVLARLTQSMLLTPDGPPATQTTDQMRAFAQTVLVPMIRGR
ncbi:MAG TPA: TetR family transcriptional regulator [Mycobacterium sp.]|nr:TetR family transcriptional regulator [Mycobacterium sp.]